MKRRQEESDGEHEEEGMLKCPVCQKLFSTVKYLKQHMQKHETKRHCDKCGKSFSFSASLVEHKKNVHHASPKKKKKLQSATSFKCDICDKIFNKKYNFRRHQSRIHQQGAVEKASSKFPCNHCDKIFQTYRSLIEHIEKNHPLNQKGGRQIIQSKTLQNDSIANNLNVKEGQNNDEIEHLQDEQSALNANVQNRNIFPIQNERYDILTFFANVTEKVKAFLLSRINQLRGIKWNMCVQVEMQREDGDDSRTVSSFFRSNTKTSLSLEDLNDHALHEAFQKMFASLEKYMRDGSGWFIKKVLKLEIHTVVYRPISGSGFIPLPSTHALSNSLLNIQNEDNKCFLYCILASLHPTKQHPERVNNYIPYEQELDMRGIQYPVSLSDIYIFEKQNESISINIFSLENNSILPLRITTKTDRLHHVNLLWMKTVDKSHYCLIKDLNRFLSRTKRHNGKLYFCSYCLHAFSREELLLKHEPYCSQHGPQKVNLPSENDAVLKFKEYEKMLKVPFVIYADFETVNKTFDTCTPNPQCSATIPIAKLEVCSYGYKVVCEDEQYSKPTVVYRGPDAGTHLIEMLLHEQEQIEMILSNIEPLSLNEEEQHCFDEANQCCLCKKKFTLYDKLYERIARHHNHLTGQYIGAACNQCNLNCKQAKFTPVIFHNLKNFDSHILCESLGKFKDYKLTCIAQNSERYVSFSLGSLRFLDSFQFLPSSLESLVSDLKVDGLDAFLHMKSEFDLPEHLELLVRKGIYPYDYMNDISRFDELELPPKEAFYSSIKQENISEEDYAHSQRVFYTFEMETLGDYHDLYLKTDVLLLCDVFESFRKVCLSQYELDPCHFYTSPGLSWISLLKMTGVELELLVDIDQMLMIEKGIRGGISQISNRFKKANNPYLEDYDSTKPTSYLLYLDANNLYGWAMVQALPVGGFRFLNETSDFDVMSIPEHGELGYILEVSLHYPSSLHDSHNCLPLAPEQKSIPNDKLSPYAQQLLRKLYGLTETDPLPNRGQVTKLLTSLEDKEHYVVHYRNLQLYKQLGMEIKQIHRILQFNQRPWMKPYIDFNTDMRKKAKSTFQKNFYKLMNVSVFGKTMENVRKHRNICLIHREDRLKKLTAKPTYKNATIFKEDLVAVELLRSEVKLNKPTYCGMAVLDLSKLLMYDFWYNHIKKQYPNTSQLQMTDTDSLLFYCETEDIYKDMSSSIDLFDTSDYAQDHPLYSVKNKKALGKMKDESKGHAISEFVGLRSKMYSFVCNKEETLRAKGITRAAVEKSFRHQHYKETLSEEKNKMSSMSTLRSHQHELFNETIQKTGLSAFDDKRYLIDKISSYAYGHFNTIKKVESSVFEKPMFGVVDGDFRLTLEEGNFEPMEEQSFLIGDFKVTPCG